MPANPLYGKQREKAGSITLDKYDYQYNWALHELLRIIENGQTTIAFVELHEDVVFADSLNGEHSKFIFCQVKNTTGSKWNRKRLLAVPKGEKNSILGKLVSGASSEMFSERVSKLRLVATAGFNLKLQDDSVSLESVDFSQLDDAEAAQIRNAITGELETEQCCVEKLSFSEATLPTRHYDATVTGIIARLISSLSNGSGPNAHVVYVSLIDELRRKGKTTWDYADWDDLVREKGLSSAQVSSLISAPNLSENISQLVSDCESQLKSWGHSPIERRRSRGDIQEYLLQHLADRTLGGLRLQQVIQQELAQRAYAGIEITRAEFDELLSRTPPEVAAVLPTRRQLQAAYLVEYMRSAS